MTKEALVGRWRKGVNWGYRWRLEREEGEGGKWMGGGYFSGVERQKCKMESRGGLHERWISGRKEEEVERKETRRWNDELYIEVELIKRSDIHKKGKKR